MAATWILSIGLISINNFQFCEEIDRKKKIEFCVMKEMSINLEVFFIIPIDFNF